MMWFGVDIPLFLLYDKLRLIKFMSLSPKKLVLSGIIIILLVAIPLTVYLVQKQQEIRGRAVAATTLSFVPTTATTSVGQTVSFDVSLDPGEKNQVSFVKLVISYDGTKLATAGSGLVSDAKVLPSTLQEPVYEPGTITTTLSVGADPTKAIQTKTTIATVTFQAIAPTGLGIPTKITFGNQTQVLSIAATEQFNENVLSTTNPAEVTITGAVPSPTPSEISPTPTLPSPTPSLPPITSTPTPGQGGPINQAPVCSSLSIDRSGTGTAPFSITLTANGNDPDGTINKVTFDFGDGSIQDVTTGGGIGSNSVNVPISYTYNNAGTFTATSILTDNNEAISSSSACAQNITVTASQSSATTPTPTIVPPGPGDTIIGIGIFGLVISIIAGALFFAF